MKEEDLVKLKAEARDLLAAALAQGCRSEDIKDFLRQLKRSRAHSNKKHWLWLARLGRVLYYLVFLVLPVVLLLSVLLLSLINWYEEAPCLVHQPYFLGEILRPMSDCEFCNGVTAAPREKNISVYDFVKKYAYTSKPVVVEGAASDWPATRTFSYDYFKGLYQQRPEAIEHQIEEGQFFSYNSNIRDLKGLFELSDEEVSMVTERWYIGWSTSDDFIGKELMKHYSTPYFIPPTGQQLNTTEWIFMGAPGPGAGIHIDSVLLPSWQAQLSGTKTWTLIPPPECYYVCHQLNATVYKGDIIVVDTNQWYHSTHIHAGDISITIGSEYE